ncbi:MAG: NAD-dependent epimerase/dehydratase family protein [Sulfurimonas sp.]|jgi:nucleoside-diphosphate-sugar epimerase
MKILVTGGNGNISWWLVRLAIDQGHEVYAINRGTTLSTRREFPVEVNKIKCDIRNFEEAKNALKDLYFDVVCDFICYNKEQAKQAIELYKNKTNHYVFISSTAVYQRSSLQYPITEKATQNGLTWDYAKNKSECESIFIEAYRNINFPITIVRPGHTYDTIIPSAIGYSDWTIPKRILNSEKSVLHGDGTTLWTITHSSDFASALLGLFGNPKSIGEDFHITNDEWLTWRNIYEIMAKILNVSNIKFYYITSEEITRLNITLGEGLIGHKSWCDIYDNSKIKLFVPEWKPKVSFSEGIQMTFDFYTDNSQLKIINSQLNNFLNEICTK